MSLSIDRILGDAEDFGKDIIEHPVEAAAVLITVGTAGTGAPIAAGMLSAQAQYESGKLAKEQGRAGAEAAAAFTAEQVRVLEEENQRTEALARASAAASGLTGASSEIYIAALEESGRADIDWLKQVGKTTYDASIARGETAYQSAQAAMWGTIGKIGSEGAEAAGTIIGLL